MPGTLVTVREVDIYISEVHVLEDLVLDLEDTFREGLENEDVEQEHIVHEVREV